MSTLTEAAIFSKKASIWLAISVVVLIFLMIFFGVAGSIKNALFPAPPLPATVAFGKLPRMDLSEGYKSASSTTYSLETVSGDLPVLPGGAKVFEISANVLSFGSIEDLKTKASRIGFSGQSEEIAGKVKFTDPQDSNRVLLMESVTGNFTLRSNYATDQSIITSKPQSLEDAIEKASRFLLEFGLLEIEFPAEKIKTEFIRIDGNSLTKVQSLSAANLVQVDFFRGDLDKLAVIWPRDTSALTSVLVSQLKVVSADLNLQPIKKDSFASYPLKGVSKAFEDLKAGNAAFVRPIKNSDITIVDVKLGYVESSKNAEYLEPVYLFLGQDDQIGYVPAVSDLWLK
ncbi:hypothetical protein A2870_00310 [Candidatus Curtissbacteria bacterium RIFCSPHIGHO2_01_FULL_41_11]|uniref:Uncharacterized protein n=1 Tax=Candidatus Curtissbacteria bacterium RIFCSPHIGHO2_01_FULL_41_11 TaxID=1797711 RepID=A0A1F5G529_9BACT|nr:MAG: hypothetical protein A2870_00310 [Candidatus Curtissbacteria bacterium RIFCSPHIGHO2_01_FULL_41_11]